MGKPEHERPVFEGPDGQAYIEVLRGRYANLPVDRFPNLVAMAGPLTSGEESGDDRFVFGLEALADGLWAHSERMKRRDAEQQITRPGPARAPARAKRKA